MDLVSVVIPTRNRPLLLRRAVASALRQDHHSVEVIVVIDGHDPATESTLQDINDGRIIAVRLPRSEGGANARNAGVAAANGKWIAFLDDDDEWLPEKLSEQLRIANGMRCNAAIVSCRLLAQTPSHTYEWPRRVPQEGEQLSEYLFVRGGLFQGEGLIQTSTLLTTKALMTTVPFSVGLKAHQDWDWILRALSLPGVCLEFAVRPLVIWYIEENRPSMGSGGDWRVSLDWIDHIRDRVTRKAYSAFILTSVSALAAEQASPRTFFMLLQRSFQHGTPRMLDLFLHLGLWVIPRRERRLIRSWISPRRLR